MFVTSDIFDLRKIGSFRGLHWQEHLLGGINVHGVDWPDPEAAAGFLLKAVERCGLGDEMDTAAYRKPGEKRTRQISPKSFERVAQGGLMGAKDAESVLLRGTRPASGAHYDVVFFGGRAGSIRFRRGIPGPISLIGPPWCFDADFIFPLGGNSLTVATELLSFALDFLRPEYGYFFVRDRLCEPTLYTCGIGAPLDWSPLSSDDAEEVGGWRDAVTEERIWAADGPMLRDLFQINLLSDRHMRRQVEQGRRLDGWILTEPGRGQLKGIGEGRWLWTLTDAEMVAVRPVLNEAGMLVSCRDRVYRDLPDGGRSAGSR